MGENNTSPARHFRRKTGMRLCVRLTDAEREACLEAIEQADLGELQAKVEADARKIKELLARVPGLLENGQVEFTDPLSGIDCLADVHARLERGPGPVSLDSDEALLLEDVIEQALPYADQAALLKAAMAKVSLAMYGIAVKEEPA